ncbi:hypothetical protein DV737_g3998, partial [Chaetothyriales sp. CBS 132003]
MADPDEQPAKSTPPKSKRSAASKAARVATNRPVTRQSHKRAATSDPTEPATPPAPANRRRDAKRRKQAEPTSPSNSNTGNRPVNDLEEDADQELGDELSVTDSLGNTPSATPTSRRFIPKKTRQYNKAPSSKPVPKGLGNLKTQEQTDNPPAATQKTPELEDEKDAIAAHAKVKEYGIRVMCGKLERDASALAGYLGLESTAEVQEIFESDELRQIWEDFSHIRSSGYGVPNAGVSVAVEKKILFNMFQQNDTDRIQPLTQARRVIPRLDKAFEAYSNSDRQIRYPVWFATICLMIRKGKQWFPDTHKTDFDGPRWGQFAREDVHRAYYLIRHYCLWESKAKDLTKGRGLRMAMPMRWYDPANDKQGPAGETSRIAIANVPAGPPVRHVMPNAATFGNPDLGTVNLYHIEQVQQARVKFNELNNDDGHGVETADFDSPEVPQDAANRLLEQLRQQEGKGIERPPLSNDETKDFLRIMGEQADVQHDSFLEPTSTVAPPKSVDPATYEDHVTASEVHAYGADAVPDHTDSFWTLHRDIAASSAPIPTWTDACLQLGFTEEQAATGNDAIRINNSSFKPEHAQVLAAAWMQRMEASPVGGGILALDAGLGKTLTTLFHIVLQAQRLEAQAAAGHPVKALPTLIICPAIIIPGWYNEIRAHFRDHLKVRFYYSSPNEDTLSAQQKLLCLPNNPQEANDELERSFPSNNPASARVVVLTSYETHTQRNVQVAMRADDIEFLGKEGFGDTEFAKDRKLIPDPLDATRTPHGSNYGYDDRVVYMNPMRGRFCRVVCDEGQKVKNCYSKTHVGVWYSFAQHYWIVSATPMLNSVVDLLGYLWLFWRSSWAISHHTNGEVVMSKTLYAADARANARRDFPDYGTKFVEKPAPCDMDLFVLDPSVFTRLANKGELQAVAGYDVLRAVLGILQFKVTMATTFDVNGQTIRAGTNLVPYKSTVVELRPTPLEARALQNIFRVHFPDLYKPGGDRSKGKDDSSTSHGLRDVRVHRALSVSTSDVRLYHIVSKVQALADQCSTWTAEYKDRGATYYFNTVRPDNTYMVYATRWELLGFIASSSVKLRYLCRLLYQCLYGNSTDNTTPHEAEKLLIFTNWPVELWELGFFLDLLGLPFLELRSGQTVQEKEMTIARFNDPYQRAKILITTFKATAVGVNLHKACHNVVMMSMPENVNSALQAIGRVHRLGQTHNQNIWILGVVNSYDEFLQVKVCEKFKAQILGEAKIIKKTWSDDEINLLRQEEIARDPDGTVDVRVRDRMSLEDNQFVSRQAYGFIRALLGFRRAFVEFDTQRQTIVTDDVVPPTPCKVQAFRPVTATGRIAVTAGNDVDGVADGDANNGGEVSVPSSPLDGKGNTEETPMDGTMGSDHNDA